MILKIFLPNSYEETKNPFYVTRIIFRILQGLIVVFQLSENYALGFESTIHRAS